MQCTDTWSCCQCWILSQKLIILTVSPKGLSVLKTQIQRGSTFVNAVDINMQDRASRQACCGLAKDHCFGQLLWIHSSWSGILLLNLAGCFYFYFFPGSFLSEMTLCADKKKIIRPNRLIVNIWWRLCISSVTLMTTISYTLPISI